eukprot:1138135-Pelagomonas_calceolata.AAC.8
MKQAQPPKSISKWLTGKPRSLRCLGRRKAPATAAAGVAGVVAAAAAAATATFAIAAPAPAGAGVGGAADRDAGSGRVQAEGGLPGHRRISGLAAAAGSGAGEAVAAARWRHYLLLHRFLLAAAAAAAGSRAGEAVAVAHYGHHLLLHRSLLAAGAAAALPMARTKEAGAVAYQGCAGRMDGVRYCCCCRCRWCGVGWGKAGQRGAARWLVAAAPP